MLGIGELLVIVAVGVLILGARRLPDLVRSLGQSVQAFKRGTRGEEDPRPTRDVTPAPPEAPRK